MATTEAEAAIRGLLNARDRGKTICPSEAARALAGEDGFRPLMPLVRSAARAMVDRGELEVPSADGSSILTPPEERFA